MGRDAQNQINAIKSWKNSANGAQVILYGEAEGLGDVARELNIVIHEEVKCNEFGTPLFVDIVAHAEQNSAHDYFVYINCDILVCQSFAHTLKSLDLKKFLMVGQRIDLGPEFTSPDDYERLDTEIAEHAAEGQAELHWARGSDYFAFHRGTWNQAPSVAIGRAGYDNVLIWDCLRRKIPVVDVTLAVKVYHQFHGYGHVAGGKDEVYMGEEAKRNTKLLPPTFRAYLESASHRLEGVCLRRNFARGQLFVYIHLWLCQKSDNPLFRGIDRLFWKVIRDLGLGSSREYNLDEVLEKTRLRVLGDI